MMMNLIIVNLIEHLHENERPRSFVLHFETKERSKYSALILFRQSLQIYSIHHEWWAAQKMNEEYTTKRNVFLDKIVCAMRQWAECVFFLSCWPHYSTSSKWHLPSQKFGILGLANKAGTHHNRLEALPFDGP